MITGEQPGRHAVAKARASNTSGRVRWWIAWTLFCSTAINYLSRQSFAVLSPMIVAQFHLSHEELGQILGAFQISYAGAWLLGGMFLDWVGTRIGLMLAAAWWSVINMLMALVSSVPGFVVFRFLLGIGEGFNWPGANKAVAEWFPREERSLAVAVFDSGSSVGGAIAALAVPLIALAMGWRWSFVLTGGIGLLWVLAWSKVYYPLHLHPKVTATERAYIEAGQEVELTAAAHPRWSALVSNRNLWGIVLGRALTDPIWWFYIFWLPQYLSDARHFDLHRIALFSWIPFVAADIGNFTGGLVAAYLVRRGYDVIAVRKWVCAACCLPILAGILVPRVANSYAAIGLICVAVWAYAAWSTMGLTLPGDMFPHTVVGSVTGLSGLAAGLAGAAFTFAVGASVDRFSYAPAFMIAGIMPIAATLFLFLLIRPRVPSPAVPSSIREY